MYCKFEDKIWKLLSQFRTDLRLYFLNNIATDPRIDTCRKSVHTLCVRITIVSIILNYLPILVYFIRNLLLFILIVLRQKTLFKKLTIFMIFLYCLMHFQRFLLWAGLLNPKLRSTPNMCYNLISTRVKTISRMRFKCSL